MKLGDVKKGKKLEKSMFNKKAGSYLAKKVKLMPFKKPKVKNYKLKGKKLF
jgi:hypothetical protein